MTTQKEIDKMFIGILENISEICDKTTTGNVSHNIATIKYKCRDMLQFYKKYPATLWHSVKEGDLPQVDTDCLFSHDGKLIDMGYMREDRSISFAPLLDIDDVDYWMEIPKLPTE